MACGAGDVLCDCSYGRVHNLCTAPGVRVAWGVGYMDSEGEGRCWQVFVMGPITVMARRPSLRIPVDPEDVTEEVGSAQSIARVSAFDSETPRDSVEPGDPPQWMLESLAQELRRRLNLNLFNFDLICPTWDRAGPSFSRLPHALRSDPGYWSCILAWLLNYTRILVC